MSFFIRDEGRLCNYYFCQGLNTMCVNTYSFSLLNIFGSLCFLDPVETIAVVVLESIQGRRLLRLGSWALDETFIEVQN